MSTAWRSVQRMATAGTDQPRGRLWGSTAAHAVALAAQGAAGVMSVPFWRCTPPSARRTPQRNDLCVCPTCRLSTVRDADTIAVVYRGKLVEQGSHDEVCCC